MIHFEVELEQKQLADVIDILRLYMKQQYAETTAKSILPSDRRIEKWNAVAATYAQLQDAYDDHIS